MSTNNQTGERTGTLAEMPPAGSQRVGEEWTTPDETLWQVKRDPITGAQTWVPIAGPGAPPPSGTVPSSLVVTTDDALEVNGGHSTTLASALAFSALAASSSQRGTMSAADKTKLDSFLSETAYPHLNGDRAYTGSLDLGANQITNLAPGSNPNDAANVGQLVGAAGGFKPAPGGNVRVASTANVAVLSGNQTVQGVAVVAGDDVLLTAQTSDVDNGLYTVGIPWVRRASDAAAGGSLPAGTFVLAIEGVADPSGKGGAGSQWALSGAVGNIGVDSETWVQVGLTVAYTGSNGVKLVGGTDFQAQTDPENTVVTGPAGLKAGPTVALTDGSRPFTAPVDMGGNQIINLADGVAATDAATVGQLAASTVALSDATPKSAGDANSGVGGAASRDDHVHSPSWMAKFSGVLSLAGLTNASIAYFSDNSPASPIILPTSTIVSGIFPQYPLTRNYKAVKLGATVVGNFTIGLAGLKVQIVKISGGVASFVGTPIFFGGISTPNTVVIDEDIDFTGGDPISGSGDQFMLSASVTAPGALGSVHLTAMIEFV